MVSQSIRIFLLGSLVAMAMAEEEAPASFAACGMAATLIGTVVFLMSVFYLLNHNDRDMRKYSANVVSSTISIFCAVLMFQAINGYLEEKLGLEEMSDLVHFAFDFVHMVIWFALMQLALAKCSGALESDEAKETFEPKVREVDMKCYATLLAHMTGFSAINAFAQLQRTQLFAASAFLSVLVMPIALVSLYALQRITDHIREKIALGDGKKDEFETLWDEETEEAENDVMGLALSFTASQALRFIIGGVLPNVEGVEEKSELVNHTEAQKLTLFGIGVFFAGVAFLSVYLEPEEQEQLAKRASVKNLEQPLLTEQPSVTDRVSEQARVIFYDALSQEETRKRLCENLSTAASMTMAWCFFYGGRWVLAGYPGLLADDTEVHSDMMALTLIEALGLSFVSFSMIRVLDLIADMECSGPRVDEGIKKIIQSLGILVGFAWEQAFDTSVNALSTRLPNPSEFKLVFAIFVFIVLVPAWKWWILPMDVCHGWLNPALANIHNEVLLEEFITQLKKDFAEKAKEDEEHEQVLEAIDDAYLHHAGGHKDVERVFRHQKRASHTATVSATTDF